MKSNETIELSPRQMQVLPNLLTCPSYEEAARQSEISAKQIHEWLKDPNFREVLRREQHDLFRNSLSSLKAGCFKATQTLLALMDNTDPRIQLVASERVLSTAIKSLKLIELDERITYLESIAEKMSSAHPTT